MPAKKDSKQLPKGCVTVASVPHMKLDDISIATDSGWRDLDDEFVAKLAAEFMLGDTYNVTVLTGDVSVLVDANDDKKLLESVVDGRVRLNNGKRKVAALRRCQAAYTELKEKNSEEDVAWATGDLLNHITEGLPVKHVKYISNEKHYVKAWNTLAHDEKSNTKVSYSSIGDFCEVYQAAKSRVQGGSDMEAMKDLLSIYGAGYRSRIASWQEASNHLLPDVLTMLKTRPSLPQNYVFGNSYLCGSGGQAMYKLSGEWALAALSALFARFDGGQKIDASTFTKEICFPCLRAQVWVTQTREKHAMLKGQSCPAFDRLIGFLKSEAGRSKILQCIAAKMPLSGKPGEKTQRGVEECTVFIEEMLKVEQAALARTKEGNDVNESGQADGDAGSSEPLGPAQDSLFDVPDLVIDPVVERATVLATAEEMHIHMHHDNLEGWKSDLKGHVMPTTRVIFIVDCPTSRAKVSVDMLDAIAAWVREARHSKYIVRVLVGHRFDLLSTVDSKCRQCFLSDDNGSPAVYVLQCRAQDEQQTATQKKMSLPVYVVAVQGSLCKAEVVPATCGINQCRAFSYESLRLRCTDAECKHLPTGAVLNDSSSDPKRELAEDDREQEAAGETLLVDEVLVNEADLLDVEAVATAKKRSAVDVFPVAKPHKWYQNFLQQVCTSSLGGVLSVLTRTTHPGLQIAGRLEKMEVIGYITQASTHAKGHGAEVAQQMWKMLKMPEATELVKPQVRAVQAHQLFFSVALAPAVDAQLMQAKDVMIDADPAKKGWRAGLDVILSVNDLETKVANLVAAELAECKLSLRVTANGPGLFTNVGLGEGDTICRVSALWTSKVQILQQALSTEGNKALLDRLIKIQGLADGDEVIDIFGVRVGAAGYARHYAAAGKQYANAVFTVHPAEGFQDGLVKLCVRTHNGRGIAQDREIMINSGSDFKVDFESLPGNNESPVKRFRGALEKLFEKQGSEKRKLDAAFAEAEGKIPKKEKAASSTEGCPPEQPAAPEQDSNIIEMQKDITPHKFTFHAEVCDDVVKYKLVNPQKQNKKVPPETILYCTNDGKMSKAGPDVTGLMYDFADPKKVMVHLMPSKGTVHDIGKGQPLSALIKDLQLKKIAKVAEFAVAGQCPANLTMEGKYVFEVTNPVLKTLLQQPAVMSQLEARWLFKHNADKHELNPWGICVVVVKQAIVPGSGELEFS